MGSYAVKPTVLPTGGRKNDKIRENVLEYREMIWYNSSMEGKTMQNSKVGDIIRTLRLERE